MSANSQTRGRGRKRFSSMKKTKMISSKTDLWVWNLPKDIPESSLHRFFSQFCNPQDPSSQVVSCQLKNGSAYVVFTDELAAYMALESKVKIGKNQLKMAFGMFCIPYHTT